MATGPGVGELEFLEFSTRTKGKFPKLAELIQQTSIDSRSGYGRVARVLQRSTRGTIAEVRDSARCNQVGFASPSREGMTRRSLSEFESIVDSSETPIILRKGYIS